MKKHNQNKSADRKKQLEALRELRGNAIMLLEPVTKTVKELTLQQQQQAHYSNYEQHGYPQRLQQYDSQSETAYILRDAKEQQHAYVNAHGGGLIPPANFSDNPFTSYMKSIQSTVGQVQKLNVKIEQPAETLRMQKSLFSDQTLTISQSDNMSRNHRATRSVQPQKPQLLDQSSDTGLNRVQIKEKLSRNISNERSFQQKSIQYNQMTSSLEPNEIQALRVANPQHHAFNTHLSKVITSVQHRQLKNESKEDLPINVTSSTKEIVPYLDAEPSQENLQTIKYVTNTPKRVRDEARRELAILSEDKLKQVGKPYSMFKAQIKDTFVPQQRAVDQITSLLNRVNKNRDQVFIPLEIVSEKAIGGVAFREASNQLEVHNGQIVFTKAGLISIASNKQQATEVISKETYIQEGVQQMILNQVPFFRKFQAIKTFKIWKSTMQRNVFNRNRAKLAKNFIFSKPIFSSKFMTLVTSANEIRAQKLIDSKPEAFYGKNQTNQFDTQCALQVKQSLEVIQQNLTVIVKTMETIKQEIIKDDHQFVEYCKEVEVQRLICERVDKQELVLMSKTRAVKDNEQKQIALMHLRQKQYNALLQVVCRILFTNLSQLLIDNKQEFAAMFCSKQQAQFEISLSLSSNGILTTMPTFEEHRQLFEKMFAQMEVAIFKNNFLAQFYLDVVQLFFKQDKQTNPPGTSLIRRQIVGIEEEVKSHPQYRADSNSVNVQVQIDLSKLERQMLNYSQVEEVWQFTHDWQEKRTKISQNKSNASTGNSISDEIEFYKLTWVKLGQLDTIISKIPDTNMRIGSVLLETASLKKSLAEMPRQIVQSIRTNVTQTIENETKALLQELSTTSDTLNKTPNSLNVYVDQVNTLRYLKEKQEDFQNKFTTIITLQKQCKQDNIKISTKLQLSIEEISQLHENQPKLILQAQLGLKQNKLAVEQSMLKSSESLALKIKAFEKKYVETYLQDKTRLERAKETLDEIFRRSQAVIEMKSKVVLYKEFLKILYQDDKDADSKVERKKLACAEACDFIEEIHKNTIKMWKLFVYWTNKRHLCYTIPFLEFDLKVIIKAISKVTKFLAEQASHSEVVAFKSQPVTRAVNSQVKDTQIIIEFVKDINKETLKERHWSQIFTLLKATHLKNSTAFTIVNLRECNIQNQAKEVRAIIEHANTEAKYESVFANIRNEWEQSNLQILPFKEQVNDYILANSELMSDAIEDNLSTLDTIARSPYAAHVTQEIMELIGQLKTMLAHLLLWSQAQKYWVTLDPIYNSGLLQNFFGDKTNQFLDARSSFRRIMWSSYRRPKTTYCLMIQDRLPVFESLINFYSIVQKQVNGFLETKRLQFSRFYFLNDAQFLNLMMLVNSNQDFNLYINMLFPGACKLFVTKLLQSVTEQSQVHKFENGSDSGDDLELQLEQFILNGRKQTDSNIINEEDSDIQNKDYDFSALDNILSLPILNELKQEEQPLPKRKLEDGGLEAESMISSEETDSAMSEMEKQKTQQEIKTYNTIKEMRKHETNLGQQTQDYIILGFVSNDKELLLFDQHVSMSQPMEQWLSETELAMQDSLKRLMIDSIENFTQEPLEEWVLDYPQQTVISTLHLILSQEINDILTGNTYEQKDVVIQGYEETAMQIGGRVEMTIEQGIQKRRQEIKAAEAVKNQVVIRQRSTFEPLHEIEELQLQFLDDCFGEQTRYDEPLDRAVQAMKKDQTAFNAMNAKKSQYSIRKPDFKEQVLQVLQHKGLNSLNIRLLFWINKMLKLMYAPSQKLTETISRVVEMPGLSKQRIKSVVLFLKHQQELVETLIKLEVVNVNDFEWQSKLRLTWTSDCEAQAVCGGWSLNLGFEYLGSNQRLVITPLTPRYFVFMASALREKQSAFLNCAEHNTKAIEIVKEFASLCAIPFQSQQCTTTTNLSTFTQLLNGGAMANTWVFFEHLDNLPIEKLKIIVKEIQLLHEQFIVAGFSRNLLREKVAKQQSIQLNKSSAQQLFPQRNQMTTLGIFASGSLSLKKSAQRKMFEDICKASFRIISLAKPNLEHLVLNLLQLENFTEYRAQTTLFVKAVNKFFELCQNQENCLEVSDLRLCIKLATITSSREFQAYYQQILDQKLQEDTLAHAEKREIYVVQNKETKVWETKRKMRDQWIAERQHLATLNNKVNNQKFKIELDALHQSLKKMLVRKFQAHDQNPDAERTLTKTIDGILQELISEKQNQDIQREKKGQQKVVASEPVEQPKEVVQLVPIEMLTNARSFRKGKRQDSLSDYLPNQSFTKSEIQSQEFLKLLTQTLESVSKFQNYQLTAEQQSNCVRLVEGMRTNKGIIITGPGCSGKTTIFQLVTAALKQMAKITLRTSYISPNTFSYKELFGQTLAFDQNSVNLMEHSLQAQSIFELIVQNYALEKKISEDKNRLIQSLYIDSEDVDQSLTDCFVPFMQCTNLRQRDYMKDKEFLLDFDKKSINSQKVHDVSIKLQNGNVVQLPSDLYLFFECRSLQNASPSFIAQTCIVNVQAKDVRFTDIFQYRLLQLEQTHKESLLAHGCSFEHVSNCCNEFVMPFIKSIDQKSEIPKWPLWKIKQLTIQFFHFLNANLYQLIACADYQKLIQDNQFQLQEMERDALWNIVLSSTVWSYGAVLDKELRLVFDQMFAMYKSKFTITFAVQSKQKLKLFDFFYDIPKLQFAIFVEKLEYKLKSYFEPALQALLLPTVDISQAFYMLDCQVSYMRKDKELNKSFRLIGPTSSSKTVILNTFASKLQVSTLTISVPMTAYLTLDLFKERVEDHYRKKRENSLVPKDPSKQILLVIDDAHLQFNLDVQILEFIRSWSFARGYYSVEKGQFKKIADFSCILSQNSNFKPTNKGNDRFLESVTTLFCNEIGFDSYKIFIQSWLTSNYWSVSQMVSKFYLLISNSLLIMLDKMSNSEGLNNFTYSPLTSFHFVAKFCANLVQNSSITDNKADVYGLGTESKHRLEEEAVADLFCYEFMRTFGDRLMRPASQLFLMEKLSQVCQNEFLCREHYTASYIEQLVLGNYHNKDEAATHKYSSIMTSEIKEEAEGLLRQKIQKLSGNQFLCQLLDAPKGLADCYKISRILYKPQQHLILLGQSGSSKLELVQLAAITNYAPMFEIDAPAYGEPLKFAYHLRQILLCVAKINKSSYIVINDQLIRDPVYYDYIYNFLSQLSRHESFVMFDDQFFIDLAAIEAQHIKKLVKVAIPDEYTLFKQAVQKLQKHVHFVFVMSDLMTYKEVVSMFPQFEYLCEVVYLEDLTQKDYFDMCCAFTKRSRVQVEVMGEDNQFPNCMVEVRNRVKQLLLKNFYSKEMLKYTMREEFQTHGAQEYVFSDGNTLTLNIYKDSNSYNVFDDNMQQTLLNMPIGVAAMNKHRFGVFIEVTKFIYDLLSMHLSSRKSFYETFQAKSKQFVKYFQSVEVSKKGLHEDQSNHNFRVAMALDKIKEIQQSLVEKQMNIRKKTVEIEELQEELNQSEAEVETVIEEKNSKLASCVYDLKQLGQTHYDHLITMTNSLSDSDLELLTIINVVVSQQDSNFKRTEAVEILKTKEDLLDLLENRRSLLLPGPVFDRLNEFIQHRSIVEYSDKPLLKLLYNYAQELYRKLNIKNTMQSIFNRIREIRSQIDANTFSINYAKQSNEVKQAELKQLNQRLEQLNLNGGKLSKKIEEAELSYMRTDQIYKSVQAYSLRMEQKLQSVTSRTSTLVGDSILLGSSVVYFGIFAPEERESFRASIIEYLSKVRNIKFNKVWTEMSSSQTANPTKSMFTLVLKDLGLRQLVCKHNLPPVLSNHQFCESLFSMLFAPSCPVICDPTGVMQEFTAQKLFANMEPVLISGADLQANDKLSQNLAANKPSLIVDINSHNQQQSGLSHPHSLMRSLSNTLYNGIDFDAQRLGAVKKIGALGSFLTHQTGQNKRISILSAPLEHISLYQAQVFQPRFDFQLTQDFLQNATFINASPSLTIESRMKLEENGAIIKLKEVITERLVPECYDFGRTKSSIADLNAKIVQLELNYENAFLIASSETFKKIGEYSNLRTAVEDIIEAREQKAEHILKYRAALRQIKLVTEASDVIYQIYIVLKLIGKQTNQITYSWTRFISLVDLLLVKLLDTVKQEKLELQRTDEQTIEVEVEIDNNFFKKRLVPTIHQKVAASLESSSVPLFNLFLALRLAHTYKAITLSEHSFIVKQLTELKGYKKWRDPDHQFVKIIDVADKQMHTALRRELLRIYPDLARQVFDQIEKTLGSSFKYIDASIFITKELKEKYKFTQVQQLLFGFLCPDMEFKSKLTLFMYTQNMATFEFSEEIASLGDFLQSADLHEPIILKTAAHLNPINLVTTLAQSNGRSLVVLRTDPTEQTMKYATQVFNQQLSNQITSQLQDYSTIRFQIANSVNQEGKLGRSNLKLSHREVLAKQLYLSVKQRDVNLDEGKIFFTENETLVGKDQHAHTHHILDAARAGEWVLLCPVQFPHYFQKLKEKLDSLRKEGQIDPHFRLIVDLQNYNHFEIADAFQFSDSYSFHLNESNQDRVTTLSDIWSKILNSQLLERLTDDQGNENLKKLEYSKEGLSLGRPTQFMQVFSKEAKDEHALQLFNKFIERSSVDFNNKLNAQRIQQELERKEQEALKSIQEGVKEDTASVSISHLSQAGIPPVELAELVHDINETQPRLDSRKEQVE